MELFVVFMSLVNLAAGRYEEFQRKPWHDVLTVVSGASLALAAFLVLSR